MLDHYDVIVIGGGHAGTEAAWAAANALAEHGRQGHGTHDSGGGRVALITMDPSKIGMMSCNPAIGGLAKGQIVREIDALGGIMGRAIDATGIMFKMLNISKGPAVRGPRAQADKYAYLAEVQRLITTRENLDVIAGTIDDIVVEEGRVVGVMIPESSCVVQPNEENIQRHLEGTRQSLPIYEGTQPNKSSTQESRMLKAGTVVLTTGTFMRALMHTGENKTEGGRIGEGSAVGISATLKKLGFELGRLKTGTPPRLNKDTIDWEGLPKQFGDVQPIPFSDYPVEQELKTRTGKMPVPPAIRGFRGFPRLPQIECRITATNASIHDAIKANLDRAPMYSGQIDAESGPRYCPSIEDKVVRFADRDSHHVFLEPESLYTNEIYCNGISTSLPPDVQDIIVRGMKGCENAEILKYGYAVEYDMVRPHQIDSTCMTKSIEGFFLAGQINGTSGYEEAGGQGLLAGLNAARLTIGEEPIRLRRDQAYIGVMLDDLVTKTPREPYRMFTSRAEYRLLLRADNADVRLTPMAHEWGLIDERHWNQFSTRLEHLKSIAKQFDSINIEGKSLREYARRQDVDVADVMAKLNGIENDAASVEMANLVERVMTESRYEGYIARQEATIKRQAKADNQPIPEWLEAWTITGLRSEAAEALRTFIPRTIGQASRLPGVSPADVTLLAITIKRGPERAAGV
ncbi:MAG: tRNA uridine-5-carboxymethylaminomethyl(34) synthesis enzyme MnmG [Planctomycetota bacterium]|nr:tRNA uridine-5-carboxymethylaminomethyl(34) synthesis enzyme MnmG [Planctomycetota bacterium]